MTPITIAFGSETIAAQLSDIPTALELVERLPLTLSFQDFNALEKLAPLRTRLTTRGAPEGDDPEPADIGYYAPSQHLVLYYADVGYFPGIVRIGRFPIEQAPIVRGLPDGTQVTISRS